MNLTNRKLLVLGPLLLLFAACNNDDNIPELPQLSTLPATEINTTSAKSGGIITSDGGAPVASRGVVWSTDQAPSLENHLGLTEDGKGANEFISTLTDLKAGLKYYIRAYATNAEGIGYGQEIEFNTSDSLPIGTYPPNAVHCLDDWTEVVDVMNPETGRTWMDRNLGASQVATSYNDEAAYGDLYQWGRFSDGHQCRTSSLTNTLSSSDAPGHNKFITTSIDSKWDWRSPQNNDLWGGVYGVNNPCPGGYRLPTQAELNAELNTWSSSNSEGAFGSTLRLTSAGYRFNSNGVFSHVGFYGYYWSSTISSHYAQNLRLGNSFADVNYHHRSLGYSIRCIKD